MPQAAIRQYEEDEHLLSADVDQELESKGETEEAATANSPTADNAQKEPYYHYTVDTKDPDPWLIMHKTKIIA